MKGFKSLIIKKKTLVAFLLCFVLLAGVVAGCFAVRVGNSPKTMYTIVIDAGHGGRDGGSVGVNGTIEKEINLKYALALKDKLEDAGFKVVLTRKNDDGLYDENAKNKKLSDMNKRMNIIKESNPSLVISIHMNSFRSPEAKGANTYFREGDEASKNCADLIQRALSSYCGASSKLGKPGDYYMVKCSYYTSVLVECGFLSNPEEERLLNSKEYKDKVVYAIFAGIQLYFGNLANNV